MVQVFGNGNKQGERVSEEAENHLESLRTLLCDALFYWEDFPICLPPSDLPVPPGGEVVFPVGLVAPDVAGTYAHRWRMHGPAGDFGLRFDREVEVGSGATPSP